MTTKMYPLTAPGMPLPGADFLRLAKSQGDDSEFKGKGTKQQIIKTGEQLKKLMYRALISAGEFAMPITVKGTKTKVLNVVSGHIWGKPNSYGPEPAEVMVIGKVLGMDESARGRNLVGPTGELLAKTLKKLGIKGFSQWYVTNLVKCQHPDNGNGWRAGWIKEFLPLLHQELRIVRPKYILCLGADASKALLGKRFTMSTMEGRAVDLPIALHTSPDEEVQVHTAKVMCCTHPAAVLRAPEMGDRMELALSRFGRLITTGSVDTEDVVDHRIITKPSQMKALVEEVINDPDSYLDVPEGQAPTCMIAVDAEWHGEHPENRGSYVRTIQISWADKKAACIVLTHEGGKELQTNWIKFCVQQLNKICKSTDKRIVRIAMHFGVADLEWLVPLGLDLRREFQAPPNWEDCRWLGGIDTGAAAHAMEETGDFGLKSMALKRTTAPRYDVALDDWKKQFCKDRGMKAGELEGYGECPLEILAPYGNYDADVTRRMAIELMGKLDEDEFGNNCWRSFWTTQRVLLPILEMHRTGLMIDRKRVEFLTTQYMSAQSNILNKIRTTIRWPQFNPNSHFQVRELLFGIANNSKKDANGNSIRLSPPEATLLDMDPVLTTGKRAQQWGDLDEDELEDATAATKSMVLSIMIRERSFSPFDKPENEFVLDEAGLDGKPKTLPFSTQVLMWLRDYRYATQVLRYVLRPPAVDKDTKDFQVDEDGQFVYKTGLPASICDDGFVRTHLHPTKETYRWSSTRPPLQNLSKKREPDYKRILGAQYKHPLRSIIMSPPGYVIVEADYIGAELYGMGMLSGDPQMIDHCQRNQLKEDDPNFYDIHSNVAKLSFRLDCPPTKQGLIDIGKEHLRIVAKSVIFGIAYGRGAKAIAMAAREEGIQITEEEAQAIIDTLFEMYPGLKPYFDECKRRAVRDRWASGVGGQLRRLPAATTREQQADMERQLMNFPIQNMIAWAVDRAVDFLYTRRKKYGLDYRLALQIHDALLFLVRGDHVGPFIDNVLPECMTHSVPIYPCNLDGRRKKGGPYFLGIDTEACIHWGEVPMPDELEAVGCNPQYAHWKPAKDTTGWVHGKFKDKQKNYRVWTDGKFTS